MNKTFYKLKYTDWLSEDELKEIFKGPFGRFVIQEWLLAIVIEFSNRTAFESEKFIDTVVKRTSFIYETSELMEDLANSDQRTCRPEILNCLYELLAIADEMEHG